MLCIGLIHGDLSEYNVLVDAQGPVIIDLPQAVNAAGNNNAFAMLERDVNNLRPRSGALRRNCWRRIRARDVGAAQTVSRRRYDRAAMKVVAVYSTKGGVGKTTTAVNLAYEAAKSFRVLLWDLDPQGATTFLLQVKPKIKGGVGALVDGKSKVTGAIRSTDYDHLDLLPADALPRLRPAHEQRKHRTERLLKMSRSLRST